MAIDLRMHGECEQLIKVSVNVKQVFAEKMMPAGKSFVLDQSPKIFRNIYQFCTVHRAFGEILGSFCSRPIVRRAFAKNT